MGVRSVRKAAPQPSKPEPTPQEYAAMHLGFLVELRANAEVL